MYIVRVVVSDDRLLYPASDSVYLQPREAKPIEKQSLKKTTASANQSTSTVPQLSKKIAEEVIMLMLAVCALEFIQNRHCPSLSLVRSSKQ